MGCFRKHHYIFLQLSRHFSLSSATVTCTCSSTYGECISLRGPDSVPLSAPVAGKLYPFPSFQTNPAVFHISTFTKTPTLVCFALSERGTQLLLSTWPTMQMHSVHDSRRKLYHHTSLFMEFLKQVFRLDTSLPEFNEQGEFL